jgi:hypothetical protein
MRGRAFARERGLTLIEVMVATALWVLLGTLISGIMFSTLSTQRAILDVQERYHAGRVALDRLRRELTMAFVSLHQADDKRTQTIFRGGPDNLLFSTAAHEPLTRNAHQSDQLEVEYRIENVRSKDGASIRALVRRVKYHIDDRPGSGGREELLVERVKRIEFEYFDKSRESWRNEWEVQIDDALDMRKRLKELQALREHVDGVREDEQSGVAGVIVAEEADKQVDEAQLELMDGLFLPARVRVKIILEDTEDEALEHVLETQVEIGMTEPLWY